MPFLQFFLQFFPNFMLGKLHNTDPIISSPKKFQIYQLHKYCFIIF